MDQQAAVGEGSVVESAVEPRSAQIPGGKSPATRIKALEDVAIELRARAEAAEARSAKAEAQHQELVTLLTELRAQGSVVQPPVPVKEPTFAEKVGTVFTRLGEEKVLGLHELFLALCSELDAGRAERGRELLKEHHARVDLFTRQDSFRAMAQFVEEFGPDTLLVRTNEVVNRLTQAGVPQIAGPRHVLNQLPKQSLVWRGTKGAGRLALRALTFGRFGKAKAV